jgi:hypothetical protein
MGMDSDSGKKVAIKIMNDNMDEKLKELVMVEVKAMENMKHVNIIS